MKALDTAAARGMALGFALLFAVVFAAPSSAQDAGVVAVNNWVDAVLSGDQDRLADILAPEFQIVRGTGDVFDREAYLKDGVATVSRGNAPEISTTQTTDDGDVMVVSYFLVLDQIENGQVLARRAPRLTVFRKIDGDWKVSAHANFAVPAN